MTPPLGLRGGGGGELQQLARVDVLVHIRRVDVVRGKTGGDPVIKQVDGGAHGGYSVGKDVPGGLCAGLPCTCLILHSCCFNRSFGGGGLPADRHCGALLLWLVWNGRFRQCGHPRPCAGRRQRQPQRAQPSDPSFSSVFRLALHLPGHIPAGTFPAMTALYWAGGAVSDGFLYPPALAEAFSCPRGRGSPYKKQQPHAPEA